MKKAVKSLPSPINQSTPSLTWSEAVTPLSAPQTYITPPTNPYKYTKTTTKTFHCKSFGISKNHAINRDAIARIRKAAYNTGEMTHVHTDIAQEAIKLIPHTTQRHKTTKYMKKADKDKKAYWQNNNLSEDCSPIGDIQSHRG